MPFAIEALSDAALGQRQIVETCGLHGFDYAGFGGAVCDEHPEARRSVHRTRCLEYRLI